MAESKAQKRLMPLPLGEGSEINCLTPSSEEDEEKRQRGLSGVLEKKRRLAAQPAKEEEKRQKTPLDAGSKDWEQVYSYEEKKLKSRLDRQGYAKWEKEHRSWEIQNGLVPIAEEVLPVEEKRRNTVRLYMSSLSLEDQKKQEEAFHKRLKELCTKTLTEEEKKLKESYLEKRENWRLGLSKEPFFPYGPEWDLAYYTKTPELPTVQLPPWEGRGKVLPTPEDLQRLGKKHQPPRVLSREEELQKREEEREKLAAQGRCLDGSYLTPYCKCDRKCYQFDTALEGDPPEFIPIWLAYCRQFLQSHCFDIDDYIGGRVWPLGPSNDFDGKAELLMELANLAIQDYNEKVFKYKVSKIEKVNYSAANHTYWMTVKVLNLTLLTPIETFQIHAATSIINNDKVIFCCRPKEEAIIGLPSCEFCFGLLPERRVTEGKEP